jgi:hypothetical protein
VETKDARWAAEFEVEDRSRKTRATRERRQVELEAREKDEGGSVLDNQEQGAGKHLPKSCPLSLGIDRQRLGRPSLGSSNYHLAMADRLTKLVSKCGG